METIAKRMPFWRVVTLIFLCVACLSSTPSVAQAPAWAWVKAHGGSGRVADVATDSRGFVYSAGIFKTVMTIGNNRYTPKNQDIFVIKYDLNGNVIWVKTFGGNSDDHVNGIAVDAQSNIIVVGSFSASIQIGAKTLSAPAYQNALYSDILLFKLDNNGNPLWATRAGNTKSGDSGNDVAVDAQGNIVITGHVTAGLDTENVTFDNLSFSYAKFGFNTRHFFIAKYNSSGVAQWAKVVFMSTGKAIGQGVSFDNNGNLVVAGAIQYKANFDNITVTPNGCCGIFIAKYDATGRILWAREAGGSDGWSEPLLDSDPIPESAFAIAVDVSNNILVTGRVFNDDNINNPPAIFNNLTIPVPGNVEYFIAKYTTNGTPIWVRNGGGANNSIHGDAGVDVTTDPAGNVYTTGIYAGEGKFGNITVPNNDLRTGNVFIAKYNANGAIQWVQRGGGLGLDAGYAITYSTANNSLYVGGSEEAEATFGAHTVVFSGDFIGRLGAGGTPTIETITGSLHISPNPASQSIRIAAKNADLLRGGIVINDALGRLVKSVNVEGVASIDIAITDLPAGMYHVVYKTADYLFTDHFLKF